MATQSATIARSHEATHATNAYQGRRIGKGTVYVIFIQWLALVSNSSIIKNSSINL